MALDTHIDLSSLSHTALVDRLEVDADFKEAFELATNTWNGFSNLGHTGNRFSYFNEFKENIIDPKYVYTEEQEEYMFEHFDITKNRPF